MDSAISNNPSLKYQNFKSSGCKEEGDYKFVAKTQLLCLVCQREMLL